MLNKSIYEKIFPIEGNYILFNGLYGAFDLISSEEARIFESNNFECLKPERLKYFINHGYLIDDLEREDENLKIISRIHKLKSQFNIGIVLAPTYNCNLRCQYCFEKHRLIHGKEWLERVMSDEIIEAVFAQIKKYKDKGFLINECVLYGGEPLLTSNKNLIRDIFRRCEELNIKVDAITNGCELENFLEFNFSSLQITVDGLKETHDKRRFFADGSGSYDKIIKNIASALEHKIKIKLRINISRSNLNTIKEFPNELEKLGFLKDENFSYYFKAVIEDENSVSDIEIADELRKLGKTLSEIIKLESTYNNVASKIKGCLQQDKMPELNPTYCGAENNSNVIAPDGLIYPCWMLLAKEDEAVGFVDNEGKRFLYDLSVSKWKNRTADKITPCNKCPLIMICGGGCAGSDKKYLSEGNCGDIKEIFDEIAPLICEKVFSKKDFKTLSICEALNNLSYEERKTLLTSDNTKEIFNLIKAKSL